MSVGLLGERLLLDLDYDEDSQAQVDANFVGTGQGELIEVQLTGEGGPFPAARLHQMLELAQAGHQRAHPDPGGGLGPMAAPTLVMATRNPGKIRELQALLHGLRGDPPEPGGFSGPPGNPGRGRHLCGKCRRQGPGGGPAHPASRPGRRLRAWRWTPSSGAPGVFSARYAQDRTAPRPPTDADNWRKLLDELQGRPLGGARGPLRLRNRPGPARRPPPPGPGGVRRGHRACAPGRPGFGYDPVFWVPEYGATMAQLGPEIKNQISHRARALAAFPALLRSWLQEQETGGSGSFMTN